MRGSTRNDVGCIDRGETKISRPLEERKLLGLSDNFSIHEWATWHLVDSGCASWLCLCCTSLLGLFGPATRADAQKGKGTFSNSNVEDNLPYWGKNFQTELIIDSIRDDILMDGRTWWIHKGTVRSWWHGSKVDRYHVGYLFKISDTQALVGQMVDGCETATIWLDDRCEPRGTLGWGWAICKHYLGRSSRDLKQHRKGLRSLLLEKPQS
jgi:hypothetical protein